MPRERVPVLLAAGGADWEASAVRLLAGPDSGAVLLKRCVDLTDLLATASTGQGRVAVLDQSLAGLDADSVQMLRSNAVRVVLVQQQGNGAGPGALGADERVGVAELTHLLAAVRAAAETAGSDGAAGGRHVEQAGAEGAGLDAEEPGVAATLEPARLVAVWGPTGAPGRTTVAVGLAAELARREVQTLLLDVDAYGGTVAQHLGVLDETSGLLAAARTANAGQLDLARLVTLVREVTPSLRVLTGLPRADRWREVRAAAFDTLLDLASGLGDYVVADTGFCLEEERAFVGSGPGRNQLTLATLDRADEVVVVGSADPVGLARLARGLVELLERRPDARVRVVVNRMRPSLGWGEQEIRAMVEGFTVPAGFHLLPEDRPTTDRALMRGRSLAELGSSPLRRALADVVDQLTGAPVLPPRRFVRRALRR